MGMQPTAPLSIVPVKMRPLQRAHHFRATQQRVSSAASPPLQPPSEQPQQQEQPHQRSDSHSPPTLDKPFVISPQLRLIAKLEADSQLAASASAKCFATRGHDWSLIHRLPVTKQNTTHVRLEDEGPYGNDEIRCQVLARFSSLGVKRLPCVFCHAQLAVYDKFPLIDGTLFTSPVNYSVDSALEPVIPSESGFIQAVCLKCMLAESGHEIHCRMCNTSWQQAGAFALQVGTLYKYDVCAAFACCKWRRQCRQCRGDSMMTAPLAPPPLGNSASDHSTSHTLALAFSHYSEASQCQQCGMRAYHHIKPLRDIYVFGRQRHQHQPPPYRHHHQHHHQRQHIKH